MSGVRSSKTIEITVDGVLRNRRYDYITQNGKVVRETAYYTDGGEEFMHCLDFFYDENGHPFAMRKYTDETLSSYNTYYYILNAQGDVVKLIAPSGNVYAEYSYDAWGNILDSTGSLRNTNPLRYRGYYFDKETGFYYLQSRYYDPAVRRFLNADSYSSTGQGFLGFNMFAYCNNNPVNCVDPSGLFCISSIIEEIKNQIEKKLQSEKKKREDLDNLILKYATIRKDGFQIDIATDTDAWDSAIKAYGIQQSYDYISNQLCNQYSSKYGESFLFSNDCVSYEIEYHVDAYMCVTDHDGYNRNITTYVYSNDSLKLHCCSIDISTNDVLDVKQSTIFGYMNGIREEYQYTSKDPFYFARIVKRII